MKGNSFLVISLTTAMLFLVPEPALRAQAVTTAGIRVRVEVPADVRSEVSVAVRNQVTGFALRRLTHQGTFLFQGLEPGGPYSVTVERTGLRSARRETIYLRLGEIVDLKFVMTAAPFELDTVSVAAVQRSATAGGVGTTLSDSLLHNLPTLNRDLYDFVRLVPQITTTIGFSSGMSGGGVGFRFNNFLINGVPERTVFANATAALSGGRSLPLDAVKEYQVLLTPYDVRYGDFAGALVNTVTKRGTNELTGTAFAYVRNDRLGGSRSAIPYDRFQYGFSAGAPIVRDRLHFFIAPELQRQISPAAGPYLSAPSNHSAPVRAADIERLTNVLAAQGLKAGSAGPVENQQRLTNVFARLDFALPELASRGVIWTNYGNIQEDRFARSASDTFALSTLQTRLRNQISTTTVQLHTTLRRRGGGHNELLISYDTRRNETAADVQQPVIHIAVPGAGNGRVIVSTGTAPIAQTRPFGARVIYVSDHLTLPVGRNHLLTFGIGLEHFRIARGGVMGSYGTWSFSSIDALGRGQPDTYRLVRDFGSSSAPANGREYSAYVGDRWQVTDRLTITAGFRANRLSMDDRPKYNAAIDSIFKRRTDVMPMWKIHWSPRIGIEWHASDRDELRGGIGVFTGRPPIAWLHTPLTSYGIGTGTLTCATGVGPGAPTFEPDYRKAPESCINGPTISARRNGDVDLLDPELRMAQALRGSVGYERRLFDDLTGAVEVLITRNLSDFVFVNLNLAGPQRIGHNGRVLYGGINAAGVADYRRRSNFAEVIDLQNTSNNHSQQLTVRVDKAIFQGAAATLSYTHSRARDVQTALRTGVRGTVNWASRAISSTHENADAEASLNDIPHRVIVGGTHRFGGRRWPTQLSFYYVGESGSPFNFIVTGMAGRGDLNADGAVGNDPIYVPRNALDTTEIRFESPDQSVPFERFVAEIPCLREQRGRIMARNSCREPWFNTTTAALRQSIPVRNRVFDVQFEIYNVLNLLNSSWGRRRTAVLQQPVAVARGTPLLRHVGQHAGGPQPVFSYNPDAPLWTIAQPASEYQLQLALRYRF